MTCSSCGFASDGIFAECPVCDGASRGQGNKISILFPRVGAFIAWVTDRRLGLFTKRLLVDNRTDKFNRFRIWWRWYLLDVIPILTIQDPVYYYFQKPGQKNTVTPGPAGISGTA